MEAVFAARQANMPSQNSYHLSNKAIVDWQAAVPLSSDFL